MKNIKSLRLRALCEGAIMVAAATVLSLFKFAPLPQGGSVNLAMLPIFIYCCRWGWKESLLTGLVYGILQMFVDGASGWGLLCILLDYVAAFTVLGVASLFHRVKGGMYVGTVVACVLRCLPLHQRHHRVPHRRSDGAFQHHLRKSLHLFRCLQRKLHAHQHGALPCLPVSAFQADGTVSDRAALTAIPGAASLRGVRGRASFCARFSTHVVRVLKFTKWS